MYFRCTKIDKQLVSLQNIFDMRRIAILLSAFLLSLTGLQAQDGTFFKEEDVIRFDHKVHDFGDVLMSEGPVTCMFTFTNIGKQPLVVHNVISSCGCTTPEWTRQPVRPGATGTIEATFSNDQGPYPFEKALTVYVGVGSSGLDKPIVLRLRGEAHERKMDLDELFSTRIGDLGLRKSEVSLGYIDQGVVKSDQMQVANLSKSELSVETASATPGLTISVSPNPIPARSMARLTYTVDPARMSGLSWGKQRFEATLRLRGREQADKLAVTAVIKDHFDSMPRAELEKAPVPVVDRSYHEFGQVRKGTVVQAVYTLRNKGKSPLVIHQVDGPSAATKVQTAMPLTIKPGGKAEVKVSYDTGALDFTGEAIEVLSVITNAPSKPILNLFITGNVQ